MVLWYQQYTHFGIFWSILSFKLTKLGQKPISAVEKSRYSGMQSIVLVWVSYQNNDELLWNIDFKDSSEYLCQLFQLFYKNPTWGWGIRTKSDSDSGKIGSSCAQNRLLYHLKRYACLNLNLYWREGRRAENQMIFGTYILICKCWQKHYFDKQTFRNCKIKKNVIES